MSVDGEVLLVHVEHQPDAMKASLYFVAFDVLHLNGHDLRDVPLEDRREILAALRALESLLAYRT